MPQTKLSDALKAKIQGPNSNSAIAPINIVDGIKMNRFQFIGE